MKKIILLTLMFLLLGSVYAANCDMSLPSCQQSCPDYVSSYMTNPLGVTGDDGCCGDDHPLFMSDLFDDNVYGWNLDSGMQIENGILSIQRTTTTKIAYLTVPVILNQTDSLTVSFNESAVSGYGYVRMYILDQNKNSMYLQGGDLYVDCGSYTGSQPTYVFLSACQPGVTGQSCPDGINAKCEIKVLNPAVKIYYLNISLYSSPYVDVNYSFFGVRTGPNYFTASKDEGYMAPDNNYVCDFARNSATFVDYSWTGWCGNGQLDDLEECDDGDQNGVSCTPAYGGSCSYCSNECTTTTLVGDFCGDGMCQSPEETSTSCVSDCGVGIPMWRTIDNGWSINEERRLVATTAENAIDIYSDPFEMKINSTYILSARLIESSCEVYVDLNDGKCVSRTDWLEDTCFDDQTLTAAGYVEYDTPVTSTHASQGFFKNVSIRIHVPANCAMAKFDDISFKEVSPINPYHDLQPDINLTTACCPKEYCWDGSRCVLSDPWYLSNNSNLWSLLNIDVQVNRHINTSLQWLAKGYRCSLNETGYADWTPAEIKYDWHYNESGYCIRETDCFVSQTFSGFDIPDLLGEDNINNSGSSCIKDGQFINDAYEINKGNHYCMNGEWTTKTYLIANVLENLSTGKPYIIFCDDTGRIFNDLNNTKSSGANEILGGCVLISKEGDAEKIITGFYVATPYEDDMMCQWYRGFYNKMHSEDPISECDNNFPTSDLDCASMGDTMLRCVQTSGFNLYKNNQSLYYLLSDTPISEIENGFFQQVWNSIVNFFQRLFGYTPEEPLGLARQTQNYEKLYVLSNNTLKVSAVEEKKYDEELVRNMVYMYLNMSGSGMNDQANKFNIDFVNNSVQGAYYTFDESSTSRVLVIKYNNAAELWPYLTAMLRDRS